MTDLGDHRRWLRETTAKSLKRFGQLRRQVKLGLVIGGALVAGAAGASANLIDPANKWIAYIVQIGGLAAVCIGGVLMEFFDEGAPEAIRRANELADAVAERDGDIAALGEDFEWFARLYASAAALRTVVERVLISGPGTPQDQQRRVADMLDVVVSEKAVLFGMNSDRWNFAVYFLNPRSGALHCIACRRPVRADEEASHRSWMPGEGHVGVAFQMGREMVAGDTSEPEARRLFDAPDGLRRDNDNSRYRSIASIPIRLAGEAPIGVVVATSDVAGRFRVKGAEEDIEPDPVEPLRVLANELALVAKATNLYSDDNNKG